jgi:hypothetical protein
MNSFTLQTFVLEFESCFPAVHEDTNLALRQVLWRILKERGFRVVGC